MSNTIAYITICDGGRGISHRINKKFQNKEAYPYFIKQKNTTFYYILEALFWRKRVYSFPFRHGLYNVANMVLKKGGKIGIHSNDMYVSFPRIFRKTFDSITDLIEEEKELDTEL